MKILSLVKGTIFWAKQQATEWETNSTNYTSSRAAVLNLWGPLWELNDPFAQDDPAYQLFTLQFMTVSSIVIRYQSNFTVGGHHNMRNYFKGSQLGKVENHCNRELVYKIYKELKKKKTLNIKRTSNSILKWGTELSREFSKEETQVVEK